MTKVSECDVGAASLDDLFGGRMATAAAVRLI